MAQPRAASGIHERRLVSYSPRNLVCLGVPRVPAEIVGGDGGDVLDGKAKVINMNNVDVTEQSLNGALITLAIAKSVGAFEALLI